MDQTQNFSQINNEYNINPLLYQNQFQSMYNMNNFPLNQQWNLLNQNINNNFMNQINQMNQMNQNNQMMNNQNQKKNNYEDIFPYIKENKKNITFITSKNEYKNIKVPYSLRKDEIYSLAERFKCNKYSEIKLFHNNELLPNDDSFIDCLSNGDFIKIKEDLDIEPFYYNSLIEKYKKFPKIRIIITNDAGQKYLRDLPKTITIEEMIKAFLSEMKIPFKYKIYYIFYYNAQDLNENSFDNCLIEDIIKNNSTIYVTEKDNVTNGIHPGPGKLIRVNIIINDKIFEKANVGTLQQLKNFYKILENYLNLIYNKSIENAKIYPEEIELKQDDERTFSSIGIREEFICKINFKE